MGLILDLFRIDEEILFLFIFATHLTQAIRICPIGGGKGATLPMTSLARFQKKMVSCFLTSAYKTMAGSWRIPLRFGHMNDTQTGRGEIKD